MGLTLREQSDLLCDQLLIRGNETAYKQRIERL